MVEQALSLSNDWNRTVNSNDYSNANRFQRVSYSTMPVLPPAWRVPFASWWMRWLQQQGWPTNAKQKPGHKISKPEDRTAHTSNQQRQQATAALAGSTTGCRTSTVRSPRTTNGCLQNLQPWGKAVTLFAREQPNTVLAWLETGASDESQRWWQHTYPQLVWEPKGPLAPR